MSKGHRRRWIRIVAGSCLGAIVLGAALFFVTLPRVAPLRETNPASTAFIDARRKALRSGGRSDRIERVWVPYESISPNLRQAIVAAEDGRFWEHGGIDWDSTWKAAKAAWKAHEKGKSPRRGGSTITQQLAKNLYLSPERSYVRKLREAAIAIRLEQELSKRRILEIYLNSIEWGERVYGAEAAARKYFGKGATALGREESAWLAAMVPGPRKALNPALHPERVARRQRKILRLMAAGAGIEGRRIPPEVDEDDE